jgi:hypothetical protein
VPNVTPIAKINIEVHVVTKLEVLPGMLAITSTGTMRKRPPADAMLNLSSKCFDLLALIATVRATPDSVGK